MQHRVDAALDRHAVHDVVLDQLEVGTVDEVGDVLAGARREVVDGDDVPPPREERLAEVRAQEPRASRDHGTRHQRPTPL